MSTTPTHRELVQKLAKDAASAYRNAVKVQWPTTRWRVSHLGYANGRVSVSLYWTGGPSEKEVEKVCPEWVQDACECLWARRKTTEDESPSLVQLFDEE